MTEPADLGAARQRAANRRSRGVAVDFDPTRLALARRLAALPRTRLAAESGVTPAAISQYEKGQTRPTLPVVTKLAEVLQVPAEFFRVGSPIPPLPAAGAHFRSLRSTTALEREQALSFGELALAVFAAVELYVDLPAVALPELEIPGDGPDSLDSQGVETLARRTRTALGLGDGPIPHVVRLLEACGVAVVRLDDAGARVDAFSHQQGSRPLVLLSPTKQDKARSRFDAAHELGHLVMHHDVEPGSRLVEQQAHTFAAEFLAPADQLRDALPDRLDWTALQQLKRQWGVSLKSLVFRAHALGRITTHTYQRGMRQLATWGLPEPGPLGPPESPVLLPRAMELIGPHDNALQLISAAAGVPISRVELVWHAAGGNAAKPALTLAISRAGGLGNDTL